MIGTFLNKTLTGASNIYRWEGMDRIKKTSDSEHMWNVTIIVDLLARIQEDKFGYKINYLSLLRRALYHDVIEVETGDILSSTKKTTPEMKEYLNKIEEIKFDNNIRPLIPTKYRDELREYMLNPKDNLESIEGKILAVADKVDSLRECIAEVKRGNSNFLPYLSKEAEAIINLNVECGLYFIKYSLVDFGISIDKYGDTVKRFIETYEFDNIKNKNF